MSDAPEKEDERHLAHGDFVKVRLTGWPGQVIDFKQEGFNEPQFYLRIWTGAILFKEWFSECELEALAPEPDGGGGLEAGAVDDNVIDFTAFKGKLNKDTPTGGAA